MFLTLRKAEYESSSYNLTAVRPFANCLCVAAATPTYKNNITSIPYPTKSLHNIFQVMKSIERKEQLVH
jgi:hypothetical protein